MTLNEMQEAWRKAIQESDLIKDGRVRHILLNLLLCLTLVGPVFVIAKIIQDQREGRAQYGFFPSSSIDLCERIDKQVSMIACCS